MTTILDTPATPRIYYDDSDTEMSGSETESDFDYQNSSPTPMVYTEEDILFVEDPYNQTNVGYDDSMTVDDVSTYVNSLRKPVNIIPFDAIPENLDYKNYVQKRGLYEGQTVVYSSTFRYKDLFKAAVMAAIPVPTEKILQMYETTLSKVEPMPPAPVQIPAGFDHRAFYIEIIKATYNRLKDQTRWHCVTLGPEYAHICGNLRVVPNNKQDVVGAPDSLFTMIQLKRTCRLFYDIIKSVSYICKSCEMPYLSIQGWEGGLKKVDIPGCPNCTQMEPDWWINYKLNPMPVFEYMEKHQSGSNYYETWGIDYGEVKDTFYLPEPIVSKDKIKKGYFLPKDPVEFRVYQQINSNA
jgi:hypothetical protein